MSTIYYPHLHIHIPTTTTTTTSNKQQIIKVHEQNMPSPSAPAFDPEVLGGDTCDFCLCCLNPVGYFWNKATSSARRLDRRGRVTTTTTTTTTLPELLYITGCYGGWTLIFLYTYPAIDASTNISSHHKIVGVMVWALCVLTWRWAKTISPGDITATTLSLYDNYPYDHILYIPHHICPTLAIRKLARSKYNRYSGTHVPRFDHHCPLLNHQAVGECNYRYFLLFLVTHRSECFYGAVVVLRLV